MTKTVAALVMMAAGGAGIPNQQPPVQNGRVETRPASELAREIDALARRATEAVWVGWRVPLVGVRSLCNWYVDGSTAVAGFYAGSTQAGASSVPRIAPATGPVPIEAGTGLVILARLQEGQLQRLRTLTDDCPIDAGGRTIYWFEGLDPARSLAYLEGLTRLPDSKAVGRQAAGARRSLAQSAISAIALHADGGADAILDRIATSHPDGTLRAHAARRSGAERGARGFDSVRRLLRTETDASVRRALVSALASTGQPGAADALLSLARADADTAVRAEAAYHYIRTAGTPGVAHVLSIIERDAEDAVRRRAIQGLAALPEGAGVPHLITLARSSDNKAVRRESVSRLGRTRDPRAVAYLSEILSGGRGRQ